ncbi:MAG: hypothetical protein R3E66_15325 [bacterium]
MNEIRDFQTTDTTVVEVRAFEVYVDTGDLRPALGELLAVGEDRFRVSKYIGQHRVCAHALGRHHAEVGEPVTFLGVSACFPKPMPLANVAELKWTEAGVDASPVRPGLAELLGELEICEVGHDGLDAIAPIPRGGSLMIAQRSDVALQRAVRALGGATIAVNSGINALYRVKGEGGYLELMAWRMASVWAAYLRAQGDVVLAGRLPVRSDAVINKVAAQEGGTTLAQLVDGILDVAVSTRAASVTTLLQLPVSSDHELHPILETLSTGAMDATWVFDGDARPELERCSSKAADGQRASDALARLTRQETERRRRSMGLFDPEDDIDAVEIVSLNAPLLDA